VGCLYTQKAPFSATQLLWLNLLMDSLASIALATEPPNDDQLRRPPVNRKDNIITPRMWFMMLTQAAYQVVIVLLLMFQGQMFTREELDEAGVSDGIAFYQKTHTYSQQYTMVFNAYVLMQLVNEINCRKLNGEYNVFTGLTKNKYFAGIWITTVVLQCIFASVGKAGVGCSEKGLTATQWLVCGVIAAATIPLGIVFSFIGNHLFAFLAEKKRKRDELHFAKEAEKALLRHGGKVALGKQLFVGSLPTTTVSALHK